MTDFFLRDVEITQFQFNVGQQLLSAGIVILEVSVLDALGSPVMAANYQQIPSNLILYRVGPAAWIGGQIVAW